LLFWFFVVVVHVVEPQHTFHRVFINVETSFESLDFILDETFLE